MQMNSEQIEIGKAYPYADHPTRQELNALGWTEDDIGMVDRVRIIWTQEKRPPRKGEWYLSGAIIEGYRAFNDLDTEYHIGQLCLVEKQISHRIISRLE